MEAAASPPSWSVLCPRCGYDLRGATGDRCSECGLVVDRAALQTSGFPWAHRAQVGRLRAFVKTVWLVTSDSETLRYEAAKSGIPRDAAVFRRWVGFLLAVAFASGVVILVESGAVADAAVQPGSPVLTRTRQSNLLQNLLVPWSAGVTLRPALFAYAAAFAFYAPVAARPVFRTRRLPPDYAATVETIAAYVTAPLALLFPAAGGWSLLYRLDLFDRFGPRATPIAPALAIISFGLSLAAVAMTVYRTGQWRARTAHTGRAADLPAMAELLLRWLAGGSVFLFIIPWCVGLAWIAFDSFRD